MNAASSLGSRAQGRYPAFEGSQVNDSNPAIPCDELLVSRRRLVLVAVALALACLAPATSFAAPASRDAIPVATGQNVDYLAPETAASLDLDFPVLVPSWVPAPFGGSPSVDSGGGYYSLYWMNAGGEPTFLQVTGTVGGGMPSGSPYDLNVQLFINASVQGHEAIHDVTPAYDTVWWIAGGVLYKVESRNSATDSMTLANSLIALVPPVSQEPEPEPEPVEPTPPPAEEPEPAPGPIDEGNGDGGATSPPPGTEGESEPIDASDEQPSVEPGPDDAGEIPAETEVSAGDLPASTDNVETSDILSDGTGQTQYSSDGTGGAQNLILGGDGTGGTTIVIIPLEPERRATP